MKTMNFTIEQILAALDQPGRPSLITYEAPIEYHYVPTIKKDLLLEVTTFIPLLEKVVPSSIKFFLNSNSLLVMEKNIEEVKNSEHFRIKKVLVTSITTIDNHKGLITVEHGYFGVTESGFYFSLIFNQEKDNASSLVCEDMIIGKTDSMLLHHFCLRLGIEDSYQNIKSQIAMDYLQEVLEEKTISYKKTKV